MTFFSRRSLGFFHRRALSCSRKGLVGAPLGAAVASGTLVVSMLSAQRPACGCLIDKDGYLLSIIQRSQQATHIETGAFGEEAAVVQALGYATLSDAGKHHRYSAALVPIETNGKKTGEKMAIANATPYQSYFQPTLGPIRIKPQPTYYSAISAIAFDSATQTYSTITCRSAEPTDQPLSAPDYSSGQFTCPAGSIEKHLIQKR